MNIPVFKIRCSAIGHIMADTGLTDLQKAKLTELQAKEKRTDKQEAELQKLIDKRDNPELPAGAKTYCKNWLKSVVYNRTKEISTKYTEKGLIVEDNSLDFIADQLGYPMLLKNTREEENEFMRGCADVVLLDDIFDAKNSWSWDTFPLFETEIPNKDYEDQLQGYMKLYDKSKAKLIYVLSDTPENLIEREAFFYCKNNGMELEAEIYEEFKAKMTYPDIPDKYKIKVFDITRNEDRIKAIEQRVLLCRQYIETLIKKL